MKFEKNKYGTKFISLDEFFKYDGLDVMDFNLKGDITNVPDIQGYWNYAILDNDEEIIYIGKTKRLKNRLYQHARKKKIKGVRFLANKMDQEIYGINEVYNIVKHNPKHNKKSNFLKRINMKNENFYVVKGWMINELGLKSIQLILYAVVYGFSQSESQYFTGSISYLVKCANSSKSTVIRNLNELVEKGHLEKQEQSMNGVKLCKYKAVKKEKKTKKKQGDLERHGGYQNDTGGSSKMTPGGYQNDTGGSSKMTPNNIDYNIDDSKDDKKKEKTVFGKSRTEKAKEMILQKNEDYDFNEKEFKRLNNLLRRLDEKEKKFREKKKMNPATDDEVVQMLADIIDNLPEWASLGWDLGLIDNNFNKFVHYIKNSSNEKEESSEEAYRIRAQEILNRDNKQ